MSEETTTKYSTDPVTVKTPVAGAEIVLKGYVTARMQLATRGVFLRHTKLNMSATKGKNEAQIKAMKDEDLMTFDDDISAEIMNEVNELTVQHMVISVNGKTEDLLNECLELPPEDYDFIIKECNKISEATSLDDASKKK